MNHSLQRITLALALMLGCSLATTANAQEAAESAADQTPLAANLFYNYYTQGGMNQVDAAMYIAPRPVPAYVGHSYYTYQPLLPHEHMYAHVRNYYKWTPGPYYQNPCDGGQCGGSGHLNKTTVVYSSGCAHIGPLASSLAPLSGIHARAANYWYCPNTGRRGYQPVMRRGSRGCATGNCGSGCGTGGCATNPIQSRIK